MSRQDRGLYFCHQCENEFHRTSDLLRCPRCSSDFVELVNPDHDPRPSNNTHPNFSRSFSNLSTWDSAPDPDEVDPDPYQRFPGSSWRDRRPYSSTPPPRAPSSRDRANQRPNPYGEQPFHPMFDQLNTMLQSIVGPGLYGPTPGPAPSNGQSNARQSPFGPYAHYEWTSSTPRSRSRTPGYDGRRGAQMRGPGVHFEFFTGGPMPRTPGEPWPPSFERSGGVWHQAGTGPPPEMAHFLNHMFGGPSGSFSDVFQHILDPANARQGDAVFTQEAYDRVMTRLMEQHQTGTAPGPASEAAIAALPRRKVTESMLDETTKQAECSICMDNVTVGEQVTSLPCNHWFHHPCIEAWLKEHDTCPVCRTGIMPKEGASNAPRSPSQAPLHDETPATVLRRQSTVNQSGTREHPYVVPESPTASRRRPNPRRHSSHDVRDTSGGQSISGRMRSFFGGGGGGGGPSAAAPSYTYTSNRSGSGSRRSSGAGSRTGGTGGRR